MIIRQYDGWIGRSQVGDNPPHDGLRIEEIYDDRGDEKDWASEDWPPIKAKVTIRGLPKNTYQIHTNTQ